MLDPERLHRAYATARDALIRERVAEGYWVGELSSSALSTATAVSALAVVAGSAEGASQGRDALDRLILAGAGWLAGRQNADGGWGDTDKSVSNISTTMLACAALQLAGAGRKDDDALARGQRYVEREGGVPAIRRRYGKDKTFSVPILTNAALAGMVDWSEVAPLPFELACLPQGIWGVVRLPVVSYAIPALVAIGQARFVQRPPSSAVVRWLRRRAVPRALAVLQRMQPASGGFLEATPLTSFVVMSLAGSGRADHPVAQRGVEFLLRSVRPDGSWPIDTNLATWATTLAINALASGGDDVSSLASTEWLLGCQHRDRHPMTGTSAGGWGWTDLSGAVPDADDTPGALLALAALRRSAPGGLDRRIDEAADAGLHWLLRLQNRDGGWPTFCRGWGTMPFDRSGVDLTAHALRALHVWSGRLKGRARSAIRRGLGYLQRQQRSDGSWVPLWFGNQHWKEEENPIYGTARVLLAYRDLGRIDSDPARRGLAWLAAQSDAEGGWGASPQASGGQSGGPSVEETAVAVEAMLAGGKDPRWRTALTRGISWLLGAVESGRYRESAAIGLYFARLWYYEKLYPMIFVVSALAHAKRRWPAGTPPAMPAGTPPL